MTLELSKIDDERHLANWIDAYMEYTDDTEPPMLYHKWTAIVCIAACLQRKCLIDYGALQLYPNMYIVLVGPSATGKGVAMTYGQRLLQALQLPIPGESVTKEKLISFMSKHCRRDDVDSEDIRHVHHSMTIFSKELAVFLGWENKDLMTWLTDWYDCDNSWRYEIKNGESSIVHGTYVNMFGATTPMLIRTALPADAIGGGFTSRIVFVFEDGKRKLVPFPILTPETHKLQLDLFHDLSRIQMLAGTFKVSEEFVSRFAVWYSEQSENPPIQMQEFDGYNGRRHVHVLKLSMIMNASRCERMVLELQDLESAIALIEDTEKKMPKVFQAAGDSGLAGPMSKLKIELVKRKEMSLREVYMLLHRDVDPQQLEFIVNMMTKAGLAEIRYIRTDAISMRNPENTIICIGSRLT